MDETNFDMFNTPNNFKYSAIDMDNLKAMEYTLVNMLVDQTGSVYRFKTEIENCMKTVVDACKKHPRVLNLLLRTAVFSSDMNSNSVKELHGFNNINSIDLNTYTIDPNGYTPLMDAALDSVETMTSYAEVLSKQDYFCNGILFVLTDGDENSSTIGTMAKIKNAVDKARQTEALESIKMILIGVNDTDSTLKRKLEDFKNTSGFDEYISLGDVTPGKLAKLAQWISKSISSTSQVLGTGGPSQSLTF